MSLRRLGVEQIDLYQLHRIDPAVPLEDQVGELKDLQDEGKIRHLGLSEVSVEELEAARAIAPIVSVQNLYNLANRQSEALLDHAEAEGIAFIPWFPIADRHAWPDRAARSTPSRPAPATPRPSWRWPGCCDAHRSCSRSPARARWTTSRRTSPAPRSSSTTRSTPSSRRSPLPDQRVFTREMGTPSVVFDAY